MATQEPKTVAFVLYPGLTLLDLVGPLQVFAALRRFSDQYRPVVVAERLEPMATDGPLKVIADQTFDQVPDPTVVIVPGGGAPTIKAMGDSAIHEYLRQAADMAPVVGSVCTGGAGPGRGRAAGGPPGHHPLGLSPAAGAAWGHVFVAAVSGGWQVHHLGRGVGRHRHGPGPGRPPDR